jgi:hypothetical protein
VTQVKKGATVDSACFYTVRGSFNGIKQHELKEAMDQHETVQEKLPGHVKGLNNSF